MEIEEVTTFGHGSPFWHCVACAADEIETIASERNLKRITLSFESRTTKYFVIYNFSFADGHVKKVLRAEYDEPPYIMKVRSLAEYLYEHPDPHELITAILAHFNVIKHAVSSYRVSAN